jgi:hypothetical protein
VSFQIAVVTATSILLLYQNVIGASSLGKELSSLQIFKYSKFVREQKYEGTSTIQLQVIECLDNCQEQKCTGISDKTINLIKIKHFTVM